MTKLKHNILQIWTTLGPRFLPFADVASESLPLGKLLRLALFQISVGMSVVLLTGTLNRVMIVELAIPAWLVASMVAIPLLIAPLRALVGFRSDTHRSHFGWRRVPFIWLGSMVQFGGLAIMPFALLVLSGDTHGPLIFGQLGAALAFFLVGLGVHVTQTSGLALATDLSCESSRPRVVALLYLMLLVGMFLSSLVFAQVLQNFSQVRLIQVLQGAAVLTIVLNGIALWKQEPRGQARNRVQVSRPHFATALGGFLKKNQAVRLLVGIGLGTAGFAMQDVLLEPYGGQILNLSVSETTLLTAIMVTGSICAFALAAHLLGRGAEPHRLAGLGSLIGIAAFAAVILASPTGSVLLFCGGTVLIGFGGGLFAVGTLIAIMSLAENDLTGLALGAWGAVQATAMGLAIGLGGALRDVVTTMADQGLFGPALSGPETGYGFVYFIEILLLFATLVVIGPLARFSGRQNSQKRLPKKPFGLAEFPG